MRAISRSDFHHRDDCRLAVGLVLASLLMLAGTNSLRADTFVVDRFDDTFPSNSCDPGVANDCSLRDAVTLSNLNVGPDEIVLSTGTYNLTRNGVDEDGNILGDLDILDTVLIRGVGITDTIIDGGGATGLQDRIFHVIGAHGTEFEDLTITGGFIQPMRNAGGIHSDALTVLRRVEVRDNYAEFAGGGIVSSFDLRLEDSRITNNQSDSICGGLSASGALTIEGSTISANRGTIGAGLCSVGDSMTMNNSIVDDNHVIAPGLEGGGMYIDNTGLTLITFTEITNNSAPNFAGGISNASDLTLENVTIAGNMAGIGSGGLLVWQPANTTLRHVTITGNMAQTGAAFEILADGPTRFENVTVSGNQGSFFPLRFANASINISHSLFFNNTDITTAGANTFENTIGLIGSSIFEGSCTQIGGTFLSSNGSNIELGSNSCSFAGLDDAFNVSGFDLGPLQDNGGFTLTHMPDEDSIAIDRGIDSNCMNLSVDQRGFSRQVDGDGDSQASCDIGPVEMQESERQRIFRDSLESPPP